MHIGAQRCIRCANPKTRKRRFAMIDPSTDPGFDFFMGHWQVRHRRLKARLAGCRDWEEFTGTTIAQSILGGQGNIDDNLIALLGGAYRAVTLRAFDAPSATWSIWWLDSRHPRALDTPLVGRFDNGIGTFYADDRLGGKPIRIRFLWTQTRSSAPRWEQAFSADDGQTWEINWTMQFERSATVA
jgi:hypothetical protein